MIHLADLFFIGSREASPALVARVRGESPVAAHTFARPAGLIENVRRLTLDKDHPFST